VIAVTTVHVIKTWMTKNKAETLKEVGIDNAKNQRN
jgi:hypothetical protein